MPKYLTLQYTYAIIESPQKRACATLLGHTMPFMKRVFLIVLVAIVTFAIFHLVLEATGSGALAQAAVLFTIMVGGFLNMILVSLERIRLEGPKTTPAASPEE